MTFTSWLNEYARKMGAKVIDFPEQSGNGVGGGVALQVTTAVNPREASGNEEPPQQVQILPADSQNLCTICHEPADKLFESPFSGDRICGKCFDAEQEEAWGARATL